MFRHIWLKGGRRDETRKNDNGMCHDNRDVGDNNSREEICCICSKYFFLAFLNQESIRKIPFSRRLNIEAQYQSMLPTDYWGVSIAPE